MTTKPFPVELAQEYCHQFDGGLQIFQNRKISSIDDWEKLISDIMDHPTLSKNNIFLYCFLKDFWQYAYNNS